MHVLVIKMGDIRALPPAISLVYILKQLDCEVTLVTNEAQFLPEDLQKCSHVHIVNLGPVPRFPISVLEGLISRRKVRSYIKKHYKEFDVVWTTTDVSARDAGDTLLEMCHIMQLPELTEAVPLYTHAGIPLKSNRTIEYARNAFRVIVPEYNRAHIQKTWWNLEKTPIVLPNKPSTAEIRPSYEVSPEIDAVFSHETRKILLYQGAYGGDRDLTAFAQSLQYLNDEYALYLMGKAASKAQSETVAALCGEYQNVHDVGFLAAPQHLSFTHYGYIGVLPYAPSPAGRYSKLNALYCAPNKIWEYSRFGLPMVGSDVPGLTQPFAEHGMGLAVDCNDPQAIASAVRAIEENYASMSANSKSFFEHTDIAAIVESILYDVQSSLAPAERESL